MRVTDSAEGTTADDGTGSPDEDPVGIRDTAAEQPAASQVTETSGRISVEVTGRCSGELGAYGLSVAGVDDPMTGLRLFEKRIVVPKVRNLTENVVRLADVEPVASVLDTARLLLAGLIRDCYSTDSVMLDRESASVAGADVEVVGLVGYDTSADGEGVVNSDKDEVAMPVIVLLKLVGLVSVGTRRELSLEVLLTLLVVALK